MLWLTLTNILVVCITLSSAAVFRDTNKDPDHPNKCTIKELSLILSPGDTVQHPNKCIRLMCNKDNLIVGYSCGAYGPPAECILGKPLNETAPYPECCQRELICNNIEQ